MLRNIITHAGFTWIESMSTENTRAPSFANRAARGLPTTSELHNKPVHQIKIEENKGVTHTD